MAQAFAFVNVDDPKLFKNVDNKSLVQSHVGKHNQNRSRLAKKELDRKKGLNALAQARKIRPQPELQQRAETIERRDITLNTKHALHDSPSYKANTVPSPGSATHVIRILPVSQQLDYGSAPTEFSSGSTSPSDITDDEIEDDCYEMELFHQAWKNGALQSIGQGRVDPFAQWVSQTSSHSTHSDHSWHFARDNLAKVLRLWKLMALD